MPQEFKISGKIGNNQNITHLKKTQILNEFIGFIRPKICLCITGLAVSGYLLFNPVNAALFFVVLCAFSATAAAYSYNLVTDKEEDMINNRKVNYFVTNQIHGKAIICALTLISATSALFLSREAMILYIAAVITGVIYSRFRIKTIFPMKNIYTAMSLMTAFWTGALNAPFSLSILLYSIPIAMFLFVTSLISDLRDYKGDKFSGVKTMPVVMGYNSAERLLHIVIFAFMVLIAALQLAELYVMLPFTVAVMILLRQGKPRTAHLYAMRSIMFLPLAIILI